MHPVTRQLRTARCNNKTQSSVQNSENPGEKSFAELAGSGPLLESAPVESPARARARESLLKHQSFVPCAAPETKKSKCRIYRRLDCPPSRSGASKFCLSHFFFSSLISRQIKFLSTHGWRVISVTRDCRVYAFLMRAFLAKRGRPFYIGTSHDRMKQSVAIERKRFSCTRRSL